MTNKAFAAITGVQAAAPPMVDLQDSFGGSSLDTLKWELFSYGSGSSASESGGSLQISLSSSTPRTLAGVFSALPYDLTGSSAQFEVATLGDALVVGDKTQIGMMLQVAQAQPETVTGLWTVLSEGTLNLGYYVGSAQTVVFTVTYDTTNHKYLRVRESAGTVYWDASPDASTWTALASVASPIDVTRLYAALYGQQFGSGAASVVGVADFNAGLSAVSYVPGVVLADAILVSDSDEVLAVAAVAAGFSYGDTAEGQRIALVGAIQSAFAAPGLEVEFSAG